MNKLVQGNADQGAEKNAHGTNNRDEEKLKKEKEDRAVDEASKESFPASDAPATRNVA